MDGSKISGAKIFSLDQSALWVEVLVPGFDGVSASDTLSFQPSSVDFIRSAGPHASLIRLNSGLEAAVRLPLPELLERLRAPEGPVLDLKPLSYLETGTALVRRLQEDFKEAAEAEKYAALENLTFHVWMRPPHKAEFREFTFAGADVLMRKTSEGDSIMGGKNIRMTVKDPSKLPFEGGEFIIEGAFSELRRLCAEAYGRGDTDIDLRDWSLQKGTTPPEPPRPRQGVHP